MITCNDGSVLIGCIDNSMLLAMIASYVKFVEVDESKVGTMNLKDIVKQVK